MALSSYPTLSNQFTRTTSSNVKLGSSCILTFAILQACWTTLPCVTHAEEAIANAPDHWAFSNLRSPELPLVDIANRTRSSFDIFLLNRRHRWRKTSLGFMHAGRFSCDRLYGLGDQPTYRTARPTGKAVSDLQWQSVASVLTLTCRIFRDRIKPGEVSCALSRRPA